MPRPGPDARAHSDRLRTHILDAIDDAGGALPFSRFLSLALYEPGLGYYSAGASKLGPGGDFVTAPELTPMFARCLARVCAEVLAALGGGEILEPGAGSGAMAADLLSELAALEALPSRYCILEVSADLRARQQARIAACGPRIAERVEWLDGPPAAPTRGIIVANEVLDALAFERFRMGPDGPERLGVAVDDGRFRWAALPAPPPLREAVDAIQADLGRELPPGYESEVRPELGPWLAGLVAPLAAGAVFLIDYGLPRREYYHPQRATGTMMCHYRHRAHPDPFLWPGLQDITAWVDFTAVADAGLAAGLALCGMTTQAAFLLGTGLTALLESADAGTDPEATAAARRLLLPGEMGERFKVMGFSRDCPVALPGLTLADLSGSL